MTVHANSLSAFHSLNLNPREEAVLRIFVEASTPLSDRECVRRMGLTDMNAARPRITGLIEAGLLEEHGDTIDRETGKRVRLSRPAGRALAIKPTDPAKTLRKQLCQHLERVGDEGATTADFRRAFPGIKSADLDLAIGVVWAHGACEKRPAVTRENLPVYFLTHSGKALLAKTENKESA